MEFENLVSDGGKPPLEDEAHFLEVQYHGLIA